MISVKDELPGKNDHAVTFIIKCSTGVIMEAKFCQPNRWYKNSLIQDGLVTHWERKKADCNKCDTVGKTLGRCGPGTGVRC